MFFIDLPLGHTPYTSKSMHVYRIVFILSIPS